MTEEELFHAALAKSATERTAFLEQACAGNASIRAGVEALLAAYEAAGSSRNLSSPEAERHRGDEINTQRLGQEEQAEDAATEACLSRSERERNVPVFPSAADDFRAAPAIGVVIGGRYKLQEKLGEGGMGEVWVAKQTEPVKRKVALKLIKTGMDSRAVLQRFEQERQALAMMDHPNIARVLDGGITPTGQPFFVMELVNGLSLTKFCDELQLTLKDRLQLFVPICHAVQHAHQKGIIHRDLKPANILVTMIDGKPCPKVIDFGVAKATSGKLTEETMATSIGAVVGTLEYMSPEQAGFSGEDIDTRSDIYSLGVILYELLTGLRPIDGRRLRKAALVEMIRIVREEEPSKPSTRLSTNDSLPSLAATRQIEPKRLTALLRGELDWVVMKCLEKQRERRYETANALAREVQRYLSDEAVEARPPSTGYRLKKFVRRNKPQVVAALLVFFALVAGILGTAWQAARAEQARSNEAQLRGIAEQKEREASIARRKAEAAAEAEKLAQLEANSKRIEAETNLEFAKKGNAILASVFAGLDPRRQYSTATDLRKVMRDNLSTAVAEIEGSAIGDPVEVARMQVLLGQSLYNLGDNQKTIDVLEKAIETLRIRLGSNDPATIKALGTLAYAYLGFDQPSRALPLLEERLRLLQTSLGPDHPDTLSCVEQLAFSYVSSEDPNQALELLVEALPGMQAQLGLRHETTLRGMTSLASAYSYAGDHEKAIPLFDQALSLINAELGPDDITTVVTMHNRALAYQKAGMIAQAQPMFEEALPKLREALGRDHPNTLMTSGYVAKHYLDTGRQEEGLEILEEIVPLMKVKMGADNDMTLLRINNLAATLWKLNRLEQSIPLFEELLALEETKFGRKHPKTLHTMINLGVNLREAKRGTEAISLLEEAYEAPGKPPSLQDFASRQLLQTYIISFLPEHRQRIEDMLAVFRNQTPPNPTQLSALLSLYGSSLLEAKEFASAETILVEALALREQMQPDDWTTFQTQSLLGGAMFGNGKYGEAESLLLRGYEGLKARESTIPPQGSTRIPDALDRLIKLYTIIDRPEDLLKWQAERIKYPQATATASETK